jgi:hypothetical protein
MASVKGPGGHIKGQRPVPKARAQAPVQKAVARKPGQIATSGGEAEEHAAEAPEQQKAQPKLQREPAEAEASKRPQRDKGKDKQKQPEEAPRKTTTPAHLAHDSNYYRSQGARKMGFEQSPGVEDFVTGFEEEPEGETLGALLPSARARAHPDLPDTDIRPPDFLSTPEAMKDIWMRTRGRMSPRTQELLVGVDLEDLLDMLRALHEHETLLKKPEARIKATLYKGLKDEEENPLLLGFQDPRLTEPWRLFIDGWEIWVPDGEDEGVELFWEGEAEDDEGAPMEIMQSLALIEGELTLSTRLGPETDAVTFDGQAFYRLKTARRAPSMTESE